MTKSKSGDCPGRDKANRYDLLPQKTVRCHKAQDHVSSVVITMRIV